MIRYKHTALGNARLWVYWNRGWVKLTLRNGDYRELYESHPTEEGYHFEYASYAYRDGIVSRTLASGGSDCDGPIERECMDAVLLHNLPGPDMRDMVKTPYGEKPEYDIPWKRESESQRDRRAEQAGY